jgi:hypothetical protein
VHERHPLLTDGSTPLVHPEAPSPLSRTAAA